MSPTLGRWQVIVVEDADRVTERGADALLKSIEEPAPRTVWVLCAPNPTMWWRQSGLAVGCSVCRRPPWRRSAGCCRRVTASNPTLAAYAARVAQGHVGRARVLARDPGARERRSQVLQIPLRLTGLGACLSAAAQLIEGSTAEASAATGDLDARERAELTEALGFGTKGARPRQAQAAVKDLEEGQRARAKRFQRDAIDRALTELTGFYRDVLSIQTGSGRPVGQLRPATPDRCTGKEIHPRIHATPDRCVARLPDRLGGQCRAITGRRGDHDRVGRRLTQTLRDEFRYLEVTGFNSGGICSNVIPGCRRGRTPERPLRQPSKLGRAGPGFFLFVAGARSRVRERLRDARSSVLEHWARGVALRLDWP